MAISNNDEVFWPVDPSTVTEEAGTRGGEHDGMDFGLPIGTPIFAAFDGVVIANYNDGASGRMWAGNGWVYANGPALITEIRRADGFISRYAHLSKYALPVGARVAGGETVVAFSGNSGFTTGPHLHWSLRWDRRLSGGAWVNPRKFNLLLPGEQTANEKEKDKLEEDEIMAIYLQATGNSSPIDGKNPGSSRIWAGNNREIGGAVYSGVWERSEDGSLRRLFPGEWQAIQEAYAAAGRKVPVAAISGNELEKMYLIKRAEPRA